MTRFYSTPAWTPRDDHQAGEVYLMLAVGYHGWLPGAYLKRVKIGLSRNPEQRRLAIISNQPPCDIKIIATAYVQDMAEVESALHEKFKHCKVKLEKSREYFDLNPMQYAYCLWLFHNLQRPIQVPSFRQIAAIALMVSGIVVMIVPVIQNTFQASITAPKSQIK